MSGLPRFTAAACALALLVATGAAHAAAGEVLSEQKISGTSGGFGGVIGVTDEFGSAMSAIGDLDGDGHTDVAVGTWRDDQGGSLAGAVWILFLNPDGTVKSEQKITEGSGGFGALLDSGDGFGLAVEAAGDLDGDGVTDLAVGAYSDDDGASGAGAVWILFLNSDGTVASEQKISATSGGFSGALGANDAFGWSVAALGDLDDDGVNDLAVGAPFDDDGASAAGVLWILFMNADGTVKSEQKISATSGGFGGTLDSADFFGSSLAALGDLDEDGVNDLVAGATNDDDGASETGAVWILFLNADGTVKSHQKISATSGGFGGTLDANDALGIAAAALGDLDGDGVNDLAVGAYGDDDGSTSAGALWILFLNADGTVKSHQKISATSGGFGGTLDAHDQFGFAVAALGDLDGDGRPDLAVGAVSDDDGNSGAGAVWILFLDGAPAVTFDPPSEVIAAGAGDFVATGDLDSDGDEDAVIVVPGDNPLIDGHVQVFRNQGNDGNGGWLGLVANPVIEVGRQPSGVAVGLFDTDAHLDLAVTNAGDANVTILLNTGAGDGTFVFDQNIAVGIAPQAIAAADLNDAGQDDLAVANTGSDNVMILSNTTTLVETSWAATATIPVGDQPVAIEPEDVDDDKDNDLVIANMGDGTISVLRLVSGAPGSSQTVTVGGSPVDLASADIDDNGFSDIAVANASDDVVVVVPNEGGGIFGAPEPVVVGVAPESVDLVDLDNDGDPDLAVVAQDAVVGPAVQLLENLGPPGGPGPFVEFSPPVGHAVGANPNYVVSADMDEDGLIDLITANDDPDGPSGGSVSVLLNLPCPGDNDSSGDVGFGDVTAFLINWGACPAPPANCPWDLDHDGTVGFSDLTLLLLQWGTCE